MAYRATCVSQEPLEYFLQHSDEGPRLRVTDVVLRINKDPKEVFAHLIRLATNSKWSHSAILYLINDPYKGFENTFLVEAMTRGIHIASWRTEVVPYERFTVGIKRPCLDWYIESPYEQSKHDPLDPEDTHGIGYLRHVRGMAVGQINGLYDKKTVYELTALYAERVAKRHLPEVPQVAEAAEKVAKFFETWDESESSRTNVARFICSGLVQYSFFAALRRRIINDMAIPEHREAALSNLSNMHQIIFRADPDGVMANYIRQVQLGKLDIADPVPNDILDLLKTALPSDFHNSPNLEWRYLILEGVVWKIEKAPEDYIPQSQEEKEALELLEEEHRW
jgi:hypothetical protein